ncbi:MAG TPA: lysophospholipid acyltransferase family protein, partial [Tepidisphaeraceae bacterium]|nr:lysophospholipid acyltransferase family protein [Tepidisphaeraceae bacterium]
MLPAKPNALVQMWFDAWCRRALRAHFNRVHVYADPAAQAFDPAVSHLYVANHASFWDGIVLNYWLRHRRRQRAYVMVDARQVAEHPFFRRIGGFSVDRGNPRDGLRAVRHAADLLNATPCAVVVFPQGQIQPADARPLSFEHGVSRIIERAPLARVVTVALRYEFWLEQRAEAMLSIAAPWCPPGG